MRKFCHYPTPKPDKEDISRFCEAARYGEIEEVQEYLERFGDRIVNAIDSVGACAIAWAAWMNRKDVVELLLEYSVDIDGPGVKNRSALSWAAENDHSEMVFFLLEKGANVYKLDDSYRSALTIADDAGHKETVDVIRKWQKLDLNRKRRKYKVARIKKLSKEICAARTRKIKRKRPRMSLFKRKNF